MCKPWFWTNVGIGSSAGGLDDYFLRSLATAQQDQAICIIFSGAGRLRRG